MLGKVSDWDILSDYYLAIICFFLLHDDFQKSGLSGTIYSYNGKLFFCFYMKINVIKYLSNAVGLRDILTC